MNERRYAGKVEKLRDPERIRWTQPDETVALCLEGIRLQSVLDIGIGSALFAERFAQKGLHVAGVDSNPDMLAAARQFLPGAELHQARAEALPFADDAFDLVFLGHVLHEADDHLKMLQEARRVARLRVGVLEFPYRSDAIGPPLAHRLEPEKVSALAHQAGFSHQETVALTHMVFYRFSV